VKVLSNSQSPHLVDGSATDTDEDLEKEDENNLSVCLNFELRELGSGLARVHHDSSVMASVDD
jgi:hypothetical protein